jgi:hypothetical protein
MSCDSPSHRETPTPSNPAGAAGGSNVGARGPHRPGFARWIAVGTQGYPAPPAQIRTGPIKAYGSHLGC